MSALHAAQQAGARYYATASANREKFPRAMRPRAITAAWRAYLREHPEWASYGDQFRRFASGVEVPHG